MSLKSRKKIVKILWIVVTVIITLSMILFTAGGPLLGGLSYGY